MKHNSNGQATNIQIAKKRVNNDGQLQDTTSKGIGPLMGNAVDTKMLEYFILQAKYRKP